MSIRVGVTGAGGQMGREVCRAIAAEDDLALVAAVDPGLAGEPLERLTGIETDLTVAAELSALTDAGAQVVVDFTHPSVVAANLVWLIEHDIHAVVGTTGLSAEVLDRVRDLAEGGVANAFIAPNFAIGAVLMMQFAAQASRYLPHVEIIELHHDRKADAPSGTALRTVELINEVREQHPTPILGEVIPGARGADSSDVRVHSVRLPGLVAHQEVLFGGQGQTLSIRHDSIDRTSFMPGVVLAVRRVQDLPGLTIGLEHLLGI